MNKWTQFTKWTSFLLVLKKIYYIVEGIFFFWKLFRLFQFFNHRLLSQWCFTLTALLSRFWFGMFSHILLASSSSLGDLQIGFSGLENCFGNMLMTFNTSNWKKMVLKKKILEKKFKPSGMWANRCRSFFRYWMDFRSRPLTTRKGSLAWAWKDDKKKKKKIKNNNVMKTFFF